MAPQSQESGLVKTAVITGMYPFDVPSFHALFRELPGIDAYPQEMATFVTSAPDTRRWYEALVFYNMHRASPGEGPGPWQKSGLAALLVGSQLLAQSQDL